MAGAKSLKNKLEDDLLTCPICCSLYNDPRVLKCQHSFCHGCLKGSMKAAKSNGKSINCAVCRKPTPLAKKGLVDLPKNYVIIGLSQMVKDHKDSGKSPVFVKSSSSKDVGNVKQLVETFNKKSIVEKLPSKKRDKNFNIEVPKAGGVHDDENDDSSDLSTSASDSSGMTEFTPTDDSESTSSGSYDSSSDDSDDSDDESDSSDDEEPEHVPQVPTMKSSHGIKLGMKVFVFTAKGKPLPGTVRVLEKYKRKPPNQTLVYAGVQMEKEYKKLTTEDILEMDDSYLFNWLMDFDQPCVVVRIDQCCPAKVIQRFNL
ncbi:uncharacterized protein LOC100182404 [Ciona intestinalis]